MGPDDEGSSEPLAVTGPAHAPAGAGDPGDPGDPVPVLPDTASDPGKDTARTPILPEITYDDTSTMPASWKPTWIAFLFAVAVAACAFSASGTLGWGGRGPRG